MCYNVYIEYSMWEMGMEKEKNLFSSTETSFVWEKDILLSNGVSKGFGGIYLAQISEVYSVDIFERFLRQNGLEPFL